MKTTLVLAAIAGISFAAPSEHRSVEIKDIENQRVERSYGPPPCAGAGGYGTPVSLYLAPQAPLPQRPLPQYREDAKHEDHSEAARSYYEPPSALPAAGGYGPGAGASLVPAPSAPHPAVAPAYGAGAVSGGSAVGVFPSAKVGGCNVPLLLSCSPSVVTGHLAESHYSAPAYRHGEEPKRETRNTGSLDARVASHHKVSEDYPEPRPEPRPEPSGNHHVVSKDYPEPNVTKFTLVHSQNEENKKEFEKKN